VTHQNLVMNKSEANDELAAEILIPLVPSIPAITRLVMLRQVCLPRLASVFASINADPTKTVSEVYVSTFKGIECLVKFGISCSHAQDILSRGKDYHVELDVSQQDFAASMAVLATTVEDWIEQVHSQPLRPADSKILAVFFHRVGVAVGIPELPRDSITQYRELLIAYKSEINEPNVEDCRILFSAFRDWEKRKHGWLASRLEFWLMQSLLDHQSLQLLGLCSTWKAPRWLSLLAIQWIANARFPLTAT